MIVTWDDVATDQAASGGGLTVTKTSGGAWSTSATTFTVSEGKVYWEVLIGATSANHRPMVGAAIAAPPLAGTDVPGGDANAWGYYGYDGNKQHNNVASAFGAAMALNDVIGVAVDLDAGKIWFSKNGTWQASGDPEAGTNPAFTGVVGDLRPAIGFYDASDAVVGQFTAASLAYTPPTGFLAIGSVAEQVDVAFEAPTAEFVSEVSNPLLIQGGFEAPVAEFAAAVSNPAIIHVAFEAPVPEIYSTMRQEMWLATVAPLPALYSEVMPTKMIGVDFQAPRPEMNISPGTDVVFEAPVAEMAVGVSNPIRLDIDFQSPSPELAGTLTAVGVMSMAFVAPCHVFESSIFQNAVFDVAMTGYLPEMSAVLHKTAILNMAMEIPHPVVSVAMIDQTTEETVKYDRYYRCSL